MSRTTITDFFNERPVGEASFKNLCLALRLNLQQVSSGEPSSDPSNNKPSAPEQSKEDPHEEIRRRCRQKILERHSQMRLLSGEEIDVDQLYVDVWLLAKPEYRNFNTKEGLLKNFDIAKDRLALGKRIQRNPGFDIANSNSKLVILGKPGSGKTTFLKHLAVDWCKGKFQPDKIAVLIELRRIREQTWNLTAVIGQELELKQEDALNLLKSGNLLVLMDGLDEAVNEKIRCIIQDQIKRISDQFNGRGNRFIMTCRTQIMRVIPRGFTSVEVADFSPYQIRQFIQNWFSANGQSQIEAAKQWEKIQHVIANQPDLKEVTTTPVLLNLICVVWQDSGEVPTNRTNLYKRGINWLLSRWNEEKEIDEWEVGTEAYRQLSVEDKENLLIEIAAHKFENPKNFVLFEQDELARQIIQKLQLTNLQEGIAVLEAIEAQHGLLVERADEFWSFSHLTFQEYFTVQWLTQLPPQKLAEKIANQQWQSIVRQLVKSQQPADWLLRVIKQAIDQCIAKDLILQIFLDWLFQKSGSFNAHYKSAAIRAFCYSLTPNRTLARVLDLDLARDLDLNLDLARDLALTLSLPMPLDLDFALTRARVRACELTRSRDRVRTFTLINALDQALVLARAVNSARSRTFACDYDFAGVLVLVGTLALNLDHAFSLFPNCDRDRELTLDQSLAFSLNGGRNYNCDLDCDLDRALAISPDLIFHLRRLKNKLPKSKSASKNQRWWSLHGTEWIEQFRQLMIEHRYIGHDWQFTKEQQKQLQRYYDANKFLLSLMKIKGAVSGECRAELEDGLLLPWAELQRRYPHLYGELKA